MGENNMNMENYANNKGLLRIYGNITGPIDEFISLFSALEETYDLILIFNEFFNYDYERHENIRLLKDLARMESNNRRYYSQHYWDYRYMGSYESELILPEERLIISKINFNSDGKFDLLGVSKILEQIREAIKDFSYRNKNEKWEGRIRILEQIKRAECFSEEEKRLLINKIHNPLNRIKKSVEMKKIAEARMMNPENLDNED